MGTSIEVQTILILTTLAIFCIYFILYKIDRRVSGFALILVGLSLSTLNNYMPDIDGYILTSVFVMIGIGLYVFFDGVINHR